MSESSVISKLQQAKNCAGKCDCCDKLQSQINNLSQQLNNLDNRFVNKNEFQLYKQNVESSFNELRYAFIDIESRLDKLDVGKVGFQNVSWVDDRIESLKRQLNELRNVDDHDEIAAEALGKSIRALEEARAARELSLRTHERMNALYNEWKAKEASMGLLETRVKKLEAVAFNVTRPISISSSLIQLHRSYIYCQRVLKNISQFMMNCGLHEDAFSS